jgi:hypothetical protein
MIRHHIRKELKGTDIILSETSSRFTHQQTRHHMMKRGETSTRHHMLKRGPQTTRHHARKGAWGPGFMQHKA